MATRSRRPSATSFNLDSLPSVGDEEETYRPKPITEARPAKSPAVVKLRDRLVTDFGHHPIAADAIARAVVDPASVRAQLASPNRERVPGGTLLTVNTTVWPPAVCPSPVNPRPAGVVVYPAGKEKGAKVARPPLTSATAAAGGSPALELTVVDQQHLVSSLEASIMYLAEHNDLADTVGQQGVLRPALVSACIVKHEDKSSDIGLATTADGSSRTSGTWHHWGLKATDLYSLASNPRHLSSTIVAAAKLLDEPEDELSDEQFALLRVLTMPATIIVGFEADKTGTVTFDEAVEAMVALIHVDPPKAWERDADLDVKATAILEEFESYGYPDFLVRYMAGLMTPDEAEAAGLSPELDVRAGVIFRVLGNDANKTLVNDGLRRLSARNIRPRRDTRLEPAAELMMRPYRATLGANDVKAARTSLNSLIQLPEFAKLDWKVSGREPDDLLDAALKELKAVQVGPSCIELAFLASFWLTRHRGLQRVVDRANPGDTREPPELLRALMSTTRGVKVLAQAIRDGRAGMAPRAVRKDGKLQNKADGTPVFVNSVWVRSQFPPGGKKAAATNFTGDEAPEARLLAAVKAIGDMADETAREVKGLARIKGDDGRALVQTKGVSPVLIDDIVVKLDQARASLLAHGATWTAKNVAVDDDDDEVEE